MDIVVVMPSQQYLHQAGPRIRYMRIKKLIEAAGHTLTLQPIDQYIDKSDHLNGDVFVFSKCNDARSIILAGALKKAQKIVGIDLFDDYFSQYNESNYVYLRQWLRSISRFSNFVLVSTPGMLQAVKPYLMPKCAGHILNDPFDNLNTDALSDLIERKIKRAQQRKQIRVGWFGIGDNPHFSVGVDDLAAYADVLAGLRADGHDVHLRILTNMKALAPWKLEKLATLPVSCEFEEWNEKRERALIADCLLCFLPVNAQNFSIVKSLNRGITTLVNGAQILSAGFPLYQPLSPFVYRDPATFLADLKRGTLAMRRETMPQLTKIIAKRADPATEAERLTQFLSDRMQSHAGKKDQTDGVGKGALFAILHGYGTIGAAHKLARKLGFHSVRTPFTKAPLQFDASVTLPEPGVVEITMGARMRNRLDDDLADQLSPVQDYNGKDGWRLRLSGPEATGLPSIPPGSGTADELALYRTVMQAIDRIMMMAFPKIQIIRSEQAPPFWSPLTSINAGR